MPVNKPVQMIRLIIAIVRPIWPSWRRMHSFYGESFPKTLVCLIASTDRPTVLALSRELVEIEWVRLERSHQMAAFH